jgi:AcrR family transcriptional regulator
VADEKIEEDNDSKPHRTPKKSAGRRRGRPAANEKGGVSRQGILKAALKLAKSVPLQDLSIVVVARSINVTPALIHYYIGGRDWLTSGIMNLFYKSLLRKWPAATGDWEQDVRNSAKAFFDHLLDHPGIAAYLVSNHRFRIFQLTAFGDRDHGAEVLNRFVGHVRAAGLSVERTGLHTQLIHEFIMSTANQATQDLLPADHKQFFEDKLASLDPVKMEHIIFGKVVPLQLGAQDLFREGMALFLLGIERDREIEGVSGSTKAARAKRKRSTQ